MFNWKKKDEEGRKKEEGEKFKDDEMDNLKKQNEELAKQVADIQQKFAQLQKDKDAPESKAQQPQAYYPQPIPPPTTPNWIPPNPFMGQPAQNFGNMPNMPQYQPQPNVQFPPQYGQRNFNLHMTGPDVMPQPQYPTLLLPTQQPRPLLPEGFSNTGRQFSSPQNKPHYQDRSQNFQNNMDTRNNRGGKSGPPGHGKGNNSNFKAQLDGNKEYRPSDRQFESTKPKDNNNKPFQKRDKNDNKRDNLQENKNSERPPFTNAEKIRSRSRPRDKNDKKGDNIQERISERPLFSNSEKNRPQSQHSNAQNYGNPAGDYSGKPRFEDNAKRGGFNRGGCRGGRGKPFNRHPGDGGDNRGMRTIMKKNTGNPRSENRRQGDDNGSGTDLESDDNESGLPTGRENNSAHEVKIKNVADGARFGNNARRGRGFSKEGDRGGRGKPSNRNSGEGVQHHDRRTNFKKNTGKPRHHNQRQGDDNGSGTDSESNNTESDLPTDRENNSPKKVSKNIKDVPSKPIRKKEEKSSGAANSEEIVLSRSNMGPNDVLKNFIGTGIPSLLDAICLNIDLNTKVKDIILMSEPTIKDPILSTPKKLIDIVNFKMKYPDAKSVLM